MQQCGEEIMQQLTPEEIRGLSEEGYTEYLRQHDRISSATIGDLISYLEKNFKPDDKVCWMDCVEGVKNDCTYMTKDQLGTRFFRKLDEKEVDRFTDIDDVLMI